jgi:hypothetical protein
MRAMKTLKIQNQSDASCFEHLLHHAQRFYLLKNASHTRKTHLNKILHIFTLASPLCARMIMQNTKLNYLPLSPELVSLALVSPLLISHLLGA